jgi:hypothetical protein
MEQDSWYLDPVDFNRDETGRASLDLPKRQQVDAYVAYGRLVAPLLPGTGFKLIAGDGTLVSDGAMTVTVNGGYMMGDISADARRLERGLFAGRFSLEKLAEVTPKIGMCSINASVIGSLLGQFADIQNFPENDNTGAECDAFSVGVTFEGVAGQIAGLAAFSRPELEPCAGQTEFIETDRCCPSEWLQGRSRFETCDSSEKIMKAARFDALPSTVQIPVPQPELF